MAVMPSRRTHYRIAAAAALLLAAGAALVAWWRSPRADLKALVAGPPPARWSALERQEAKWRGEGLQRKVEFEYRPLASISVELQLAVLVSEDIGYFGHGALDFSAVWEAIAEWWHGGRLRGASTVAQQLAKILFLTPERSLSRKLEEVRLAWWLEHELGKGRILELYLNVVEFGPGVVGAEAASRHYFAADAGSLTAEQAAGLAAAIPSPGRDNVTTGSARWAARRALILERMHNAAWLRRRLEALRG